MNLTLSTSDYTTAEQRRLAAIAECIRQLVKWCDKLAVAVSEKHEERT